MLSADTIQLEQLLRNIIPATNIKTSLVDRMAYAGDAGFYHLLPIAVVQPGNEKEIADLFTLAQLNKVPLCFRAAGTSLSGQSITDGILVDIGKHWRKITPLENGKQVKVQPGIIGSMVNHFLSPYKTKIGPDPSSINAAMMGGILSNNSSGMCCGVAYNSYHTLKTIRFILPDGKTYDSAIQSDYTRFTTEQAALAELLIDQRTRILNNQDLLHKVRHKYKTKNTVGYSLNALIDYEHPLDIFAHLLIGAEGTLAFISEAVMQTIPVMPATATAMLYFPSMYAACAAIAPLNETGAAVLELMDRASLRSVETMKGLPDFFTSLPDSAACLLCEYQAEDIAALELQLQKAASAIDKLELLHPAAFTRDHQLRDFYWKIRKGMFPSVGAVRARGTTVILEDVAFPVELLADAVIALQDLFRKYAYDNAIIFGHAKDGNIHFVITQLLDTPEEIDRYDRFLKEMVQLVLEEYKGTLKAEHGTGRNMAPFVEAEWGGELYAIMQSIKSTVDPNNILNPGVIINTDQDAHIRHLKQMPVVEAEVDKCIECGYCEPLCPSRDVTLSPRQRIQVRRALQRLDAAGDQESYNTLLKEYQYAGLDTCATDGLCQVECPVYINTGDLVKRLRRENHNKTANRTAEWVARNFGFAEKLIRIALRSGTLANKIFGASFMYRFTGLLQKIMPSFPRWWNELYLAPRLPQTNASNAGVVYFSSCLHRMMGGTETKSIQQTFIDVCNKAGIQVYLPEDLPGHCCGQAFSSKGYQSAANLMEEKTIDALLRWTNNGAMPVVCDFTSCTYTFLKNQAHLSAEYQEKFSRIQLLDCIEYLQTSVTPKLLINKKKQQISLHPSCAAIKLNLSKSMQQTAALCSENVHVPAYAGCCGMAGDRGFIFPELTQAASAKELAHLIDSEGYYSTARTCEMALSHHSGKPYTHLVYLLDEVSS